MCGNSGSGIPDLRLLASTYRLTTEEGGTRYDPWYCRIRCKHGHICPWGHGLLAACTNRRTTRTLRLLAVPGSKLVQDGEDGVNVTFPTSELDRVARIMGAYRKRKLSEEHRRKLAEAGSRFHFRHGSGARVDELERAQTTLDDSEVDR